jgi:hypothetical protein
MTARTEWLQSKWLFKYLGIQIFSIWYIIILSKRYYTFAISLILGPSHLGFHPAPQDLMVTKINEQLKTSAPAWITYSTPNFPDRIRTGINHFELNSYCLQILLTVLIIRPTVEMLKAKFAFLSSHVWSSLMQPSLCFYCNILSG